MKKIITVLFVFLSIMTGIILDSECLALTRVVPENTKDEIIEKYLKNRPLDIVEGVWSFSIMGNYGEMAITKNTTSFYKNWDYIGIMLNNALGKIGEAKIILKKTTSPGLYPGGYIAMDSPILSFTTFVMQQNNIMQFILPAKDIGLVTFLRIDNLASTQPEGTGTGFFITNDLIATSAHVIKEAKKIIVAHGEQKALAKVVAQDLQNDVAILKVYGMEGMIEPLPLGDPRKVNLGQAVSTVGFPMPNLMGVMPKAGEGIINSLSGIHDDIRLFQVSIPIQPGNSGGPLLNEKGQVIGMISAKLNELYAINYKGTIMQNVNYAVKISYLMNVSPISLQYSNDTEILSTQEVIRRAGNAVVFITTEG
ncbi:MAG: serine protease [Acidaminococcaceae bacterium]